jgi:hypothetical protein
MHDQIARVQVSDDEVAIEDGASEREGSIQHQKRRGRELSIYAEYLYNLASSCLVHC